eukprot:m.331041 g.331041  ORF g.331041 m.331041 type:complete len:61 (+) comp69642_c0_seq1:335-517(+)
MTSSLCVLPCWHGPLATGRKSNPPIPTSRHPPSLPICTVHTSGSVQIGHCYSMGGQPGSI